MTVFLRILALFGLLFCLCAQAQTHVYKEGTHFDHDKTTYPLIGKHKTLKCADCHRDGPFRVRSACVSCHLKNDTHKGGQGTECGDCHTQKNWKDRQFDHDAKTTYPLLGQHKTLSCTDCHTDDTYQDHLPTDCASCHSRKDIHKGELGHNCEACHTEEDWKKSLFDHRKQTGVPLQGSHIDAPCTGCHIGGKFKGKKIPDLCVYCHAKDDRHKHMFGAICANCHTEQAWSTLTFTHDRPPFFLKGKHKQVKCQLCHQGRIYVVKPPHECVSCHQNNDKHKGKLGTKCDSCHDEDGWKDSVLE